MSHLPALLVSVCAIVVLAILVLTFHSHDMLARLIDVNSEKQSYPS